MVRTVRDAPVPSTNDTLAQTPADPDALTELAERYGLAGPITRLVKAMANR